MLKVTPSSFRMSARMENAIAVVTSAIQLAINSFSRWYVPDEPCALNFLPPLTGMICSADLVIS
jgi:hypothetical protein